ncbi:hypothetical protein P4050_30535 [Pseudomonas aeruginosa]|nr:hypothetical protein [Pseudomonas aeruginosa]
MDPARLGSTPSRRDLHRQTVGDHRRKVNLVPVSTTPTPQSVTVRVRISSGVVAGRADGWFTGG